MSEIKVLPSIDQVTLVLQATGNIPISHWSNHAKEIIDVFMKKSRLAEVFGFEEKGRLFEGYNAGMTTFNAPFYCCIAFHETVKNMGIVVHFSGWAFHRYKEKTKWNIHDLIQQTSDSMYSIRLSRIDNVVDITNSNIELDELYKSIVNEETILQFENGRRNPSKLKPYIEKNLEIESFYVGSLKRSNTILRAYDKKREMIDTNGYLKNFYENFESVIRFEQKLRGNLAHQATDKIMTIKTNDELKDYIISSITSKYRFWNAKKKKYRLVTKLMLEALNEKNFEFQPVESRANSLEATRMYLMNNSGLFTYLHKLNEIYGEDTAYEGIEDLYRHFLLSNPNESVEKWLSKYQLIYREQTKPWEESASEKMLSSLLKE